MGLRFAQDSDAIKLLRKNVREIEDFPREGIACQDVTSLLRDPDLFRMTIAAFVVLLKNAEFDLVLGIDSRGFMFGPPLAKALGKKFYPLFKSRGKIGSVVTEQYQYEYGEDELTLPEDAIAQGTRCLIVDDQIVTGGTAVAATRLVERLGGEVAGLAFILSQSIYPGVERLERYPMYALFEKNPRS